MPHSTAWKPPCARIYTDSQRSNRITARPSLKSSKKHCSTVSETQMRVHWMNFFNRRHLRVRCQICQNTSCGERQDLAHALITFRPPFCIHWATLIERSPKGVLINTQDFSSAATKSLPGRLLPLLLVFSEVVCNSSVCELHVAGWPTI